MQAPKSGRTLALKLEDVITIDFIATSPIFNSAGGLFCFKNMLLFGLQPRFQALRRQFCIKQPFYGLFLDINQAAAQ
jgi:hypothetical protein